METLRIVNKAFEGEPEYPVLQNIITNQTYEFSQITNDSISDKDLNHPIIQEILSRGHHIKATIEGDNVNLIL